MEIPVGEKVEKVGHLAVKLLKLEDDKVKFNLETDINGRSVTLAKRFAIYSCESSSRLR